MSSSEPRFQCQVLKEINADNEMCSALRIDYQYWKCYVCLIISFSSQSKSATPRILNIGARWIWVIYFTFWSVQSQTKRRRHRSERTLGSVQSRPGLDLAKRRNPYPYCESNTGIPARNLVPTPTKQVQKLRKGFRICLEFRTQFPIHKVYVRIVVQAP
jgi:hypothetical protein